MLIFLILSLRIMIIINKQSQFSKNDIIKKMHMNKYLFMSINHVQYKLL